MNYEQILAQYTDTYLDINQCQKMLESRWSTLARLLPPKWWYESSPIRQWLNYSDNEVYETALNLFQDELLLISTRFPDHYKTWIGSISIPEQFWAKRFEAAVIYLLIHGKIDIQALDVKSDVSNNDVDIVIGDGTERIYIECTSVRNPPVKAELQEINRHVEDYIIHEFNQIPGSYLVTCNVLPNFLDKSAVDQFIDIFATFIQQVRPVNEVRWDQIKGFPTNRPDYGQPAAIITPTHLPIRTRITGFPPQAFVDTSGQALYSKIKRKFGQSRGFSGQRILMIDSSFRPDMYITNFTGFKDDVGRAAEFDKNHQTFSIITLSQINIQSERRLFMGTSFPMPWTPTPLTPLARRILEATYMI
ncbi:hypothetical protein [Alicyclobacillus mengziensis]|uniref:PD-(D/E)XK nuclease superfamily protein n=1 Tax=Alicyclobacillus mengziensis TaxID=2931921 RepID=A0A9X7W1D3_9BACL|nr:hypothetical protein [Alicyclobacillus mengziensis]QSO48387.1 hypothetical protein JZ786_05210 [Alicyclobacillus mengziensis]